MTPQEFTLVLAHIAKVWPKFYAEQSPDAIFSAWYPYFKNDDAKEVEAAVAICVCSLRFPPVIADIKAQMAELRMENQLTPIEAFQRISEAVDRTYNKDDAVREFKALPPLLRKVCGNYNRLLKWSKVSNEAFETVIMSAIRTSYETIVKREAKYHALPGSLQKAVGETETPTLEGLPEPSKPKTVDEIIAESYGKAAEHGMTMTDALREKNAGKVEAFLKPVTAEERKLVEERDRARSERYL